MENATLIPVAVLLIALFLLILTAGIENSYPPPSIIVIQSPFGRSDVGCLVTLVFAILIIIGVMVGAQGQ